MIQSVSGVLAVNVTNLTRVASSTGGDFASVYATIAQKNQWLSNQGPVVRPLLDPPGGLLAYLPVANPFSPPPSSPPTVSSPQPAEILVIDPQPGNVVLEIMS